MAELIVQLFGRFSAAYGGVELTALHTARLHELLAYLILHQDAPSFRFQLAYYFWPDSREDQARTNLRNLVHLLRQALPDFDGFIRSDARTLQWRAEAPFTLDVFEFEKLLAQSPGSTPDKERLERAVAVYQGDLLPSCYADWIIPRLQRLQQAFQAALEAAG